MQVNERNDQTTTRVFIMVRLQGLFFLALRPRPEYPTREFLSLVNKLLSPAEKTLHVAYTFTDTKLDVEFFYMGSTTPVRRLHFYRHKARCRVLYQGYNHSQHSLYFEA